MKNIVCCFFASVFIFLFGIPAFSQTYVGYVAEISGNWQLNGQGSLRQGQKLPASAKISSNPNRQINSIKIADLNGRVRSFQKCPQSCTFYTPNAPSRTSFFSTIFSSIMDLVWSSSSESYSAHRSKGKGKSLPDGVVKLENEKIDLTGLQKMPKKFFLKWRKIKSVKNQEFDDWSKPIEIKSEYGDLIIPFAGFQAGLYEFCSIEDARNLGEKSANSCPANAAWIFVSRSEKYEQIKKEFEETKTAVDELTKPQTEMVEDKETEIPGIDSATAKLYLRAYLDGLAQATSGNPETSN